MTKPYIRKNRVTLVVTDKELKELKARAERAELTMSDYIRQVAIYKEEK